MNLNFKLALVFLAYITIAVCEPTVPKWSESYKAKGTLYLPYAEIEEPFEAWYDAPSQRSRIDFYDGMAKTYQLGDDGFGIRLKIVPFTTDEFLNEITCFQVNGTEEEAVGPQSILPVLEEFQFEGAEVKGDLEIEQWSLTEVILEKRNVYTMWITYDSHHHAVPIKYDMKGYNTLLGSHYDHYYLEYDSYHIYTDDDFPSDVFHVEVSECRSYPGPGNQNYHNVNPIAEFIRPEKSEHIDHHFNEFISTHDKNYDDVNEHFLRKEIFRQNFRFIHSVNRQNKGFSLAINHLADKTDDEIKILRGRISSGEYNGGQPFPYDNIKSDDFPDQYDWRLYGAVTPVKDQAVCGSCWAFATIGHLEGALFLKSGSKNLVQLSEQALVDCSWGYGNNGCDGGEDFRSFGWVLTHGGIPLDSEYGSYLGQDGFCHADDVGKVATITGWVNVTSNDENALRLAIFKQGPISVSINAGLKTFSFYSNGVYYGEDCGNTQDDLNHAVLAVGYGTINGEDYWLIKNSWSTYWGDDGYILMSARDNNCGVMTSPTYVTM